MNQNTKESRRSAHPSRLKPLALFLAGLAIGTSAPLAAADEKSAAELQAELKKANTEIQNLKKELERNRGGIATPQAAPVATAVAAREESVEAATATQTLDSVVVRSRRQLEKLHDVPVSISVVSGGELDREQATDLEALTKRLGNITFNQNNTRGSSLSIRGLGRRGFTETQDPSVGLIVDGVSYGLSQLGNFDFYDVQSVEVARGPQGTLLGKGASAGAVTVTSRGPSFTPSANYEVTYGQRETVFIKGALGGPIIDDLLAWRGSFVVNKQRGAYTVAEDTDREADTMYNRDRVSARTQFLLTPTADLNAKLSLDIQPRATQLQNGFTEFVQQPQRYANGTLVDPNGTGTQARLGRDWFQGRNFTYDQLLNSIGREGKVYQNQTQGQTAGTSGASAEVNYNLTDKLTLTSITAHRIYNFQARNDEGTPFDVQKNGGGSVFYNQTSQEFRLAGKPNKFVDYQTGLYFLRTENEVESKNGYGADAGAWYANNNQYNTLVTNAGLNASAGGALLTNSLKDLFRFGQQNINTFSQALYGQANFHLSDALTVTAGLRIGTERRTTENFADLRNNGVGAALNPVSSRGTALGGFNSIAYSNASVANGTAGNLVNPSTAQLALADSVAQKYFGAASYASLSPAQKAQVAAAKAIRASQIGALITGVRSDYKDQIHTAVLSPKYKFNDNVTAYASWQYGEKSGSALNVNGVATTVKPERTNAYELGVKTFLLDKTLTLNADVYLMDIKDYQQNVVAVDQFATQDNINNNVTNPLAYTSVQGNVPKVQVSGVEVDAAYNGLRYTSLRAAASYNDARYKDFPNAGKPSELAYLSSPFIDRSGQRLGEAPYWTVNVSGEYRRPVFGDKVFHTSFTTAYIGSTTTDELMSDYSWVPDRATTDLAIGLGHHKGNYDVTLIAKNAFNNNAHEKGWNSYTPYPYPRWFGIVLSGKL
ncbi:TonB-dependent receptor [Zoogloea oleivorans]|jgi:iron complex outermembrane receptor protein|uniref:TonB-dependent receptor n=1 Tax=Zoogloea oleivorans TaxID=1552750 RepID=A0A6C2CM67_9RHOO|nr:TonB-dependent receptor [Zoogloea oleivorans]TYC54449.1 TonB-dependent receptor [Zoogloea oleivorans]